MKGGGVSTSGAQKLDGRAPTSQLSPNPHFAVQRAYKSVTGQHHSQKTPATAFGSGVYADVLCYAARFPRLDPRAWKASRRDGRKLVMRLRPLTLQRQGEMSCRTIRDEKTSRAASK